MTLDRSQLTPSPCIGLGGSAALVLVGGGAAAGLALVLFDLVQAETNPELLDLPPADGVPSGMEGFSRPLGISNPGEGARGTGYAGLPRGAPGARNVAQIGGAQNTSGQAGGSVGRSTAVEPGVGQAAPVLVARDSDERFGR